MIVSICQNGGPDGYRDYRDKAEMAELVDARDSNSRSFGVRVRFPLSVQKALILKDWGFFIALDLSTV